jgi:hypothetical protein
MPMEQGSSQPIPSSFIAGNVGRMSEMPVYTLTPVEEWKCHAQAIHQYWVAPEELSTEPRHNTRLSTHQQVAELAESIAAEVVVARYFGLDYSIEESCFKRKADVGEGLEVRWTHYDNGQLIVRGNDRENDIAVLVVGRSPNFKIAGWIPVTVARKPRYKNGIESSWFVPQNNLAPINELAGSKYARAIR